MTGSQTPQRAIRRLVLLGGRSERLGSALASSPLLDDPIAILTGESLDEGALEAVLSRLESNAAGSTAAPAARPRGGLAARRARRRTSPIVPALRAEAVELPVDVPIRRRPVSGERVRASRPRIAKSASLPAPPARSSLAAAAKRAGSQTPGSASTTSSLARAAARVPGGAAAIVTPVSAEWTSSEPVAAEWAAAAESGAVESASAESEPVGAANAPTLLQAVLARAGTDPVDTAEPPRGRPSASVSERLPQRPSLADALVPSRIAAHPPAPLGAQLAAEPSTFPAVAPAAAEPAAESAEADISLPAGSGGSGLAELVRRWEATHGRDREGDPAGVRIETGRAAATDIETESALARAVERLLAAELRRSGIEVDVG